MEEEVVEVGGVEGDGGERKDVVVAMVECDSVEVVFPAAPGKRKEREEEWWVEGVNGVGELERVWL